MMTMMMMMLMWMVVGNRVEQAGDHPGIVAPLGYWLTNQVKTTEIPAKRAKIGGR